MQFRPNASAAVVLRSDTLFTTEVITLTNRGLVRAQNLQFALVAGSANSLPNWVSLASAATLAELPPGADVALQLRIAPGAAVVDGVYELGLQVMASNAPTSTYGVTVVVNQQGEGRVNFKIEDIFTATLDSNNNPILGVANARVVLRNEAIASQSVEGRTDASGTVILGPIAPGRYVYQVSGPRHEAGTGRVLVRPGITVDQRVFIDYQTVSFTWQVVPTTIPDNYHINITTTFQTLIPAPVVVLAPASINFPDLQVGEVISGELSLTNYGLIRARNVRMNLPVTDQYFRYEFQGSVPDTLEANQQVLIPYSITALAPLPENRAQEQRAALNAWINDRPEPNRAPLSGCRSYSTQLLTNYEYVCANGDIRQGSARTQMSKAYGNSCSAASPPIVVGGGGGGISFGGGWTGGGGSGGNFTPTGPECSPDCTEGCGCAAMGCNAPNNNNDDDPNDENDDNNDQPPPRQCERR